MYAILCAIVLLGVSQADPILKSQPIQPIQPQTETQPPAFCNGLECPPFEVLDKNENYEERRYESSKWVTTEFTSMDYDSASSVMFWKLFNYISGENKNGQKIDMTAPVITQITPGQGPACESYFKMSFFVAGDNPPEPTAADVYLSDLPQDFGTYVKSYGGWQTDEKFLRYAAELAQQLPESASYRTDFYFIAGYDSPYKPFNRHNEIWFVKK